MAEFDHEPTPRGFQMLSFRHHMYGPENQRAYPAMSGEFSVQESSLADERKVWIGFKSDQSEQLDVHRRAHLNEEEAYEVAQALLRWLAQGEGTTAMIANSALAEF
jgi:hypothetical protein